MTTLGFFLIVLLGYAAGYFTRPFVDAGIAKIKGKK